MRYTLENGVPSLIKVIRHDGWTITNPTDVMIDEWKLGYPLIETEAPEYDPDEEKISFTWEIIQDSDPAFGESIVKVWTVTALTAEEKNAKFNQALDAQIDAINAGFETFKTTPVNYTFKNDTMKLKPIWTTEYYGTLAQVGMLVGESMFPTVITDADGVNFTMTQEEFMQMYLWLIQVSYEEISRVNARLAELEEERK